MKHINLLTVLFFGFFLQGCLPDSFTKFREDPAVNAQGGSGAGGTEACPAGSENDDPFCLRPTSIEYSQSYYQINIGPDNTGSTTDPLNDEDDFFWVEEARVLNASNVDGYDQFMTFAIQELEFDSGSGQYIPTGNGLPASTGLIFDVETGLITGEPQEFLPRTRFRITAQYSGETPVSLTSPSQYAEIEISIATDLLATVSIVNPLDKIVVIDADNVAPFVGREWVSAQDANNGSARLDFVDQVSNQIHIDTDDIGSNGNFILARDNVLDLDRREVYSSSQAKSSSFIFALGQNQELSVDDGALSTSIKFEAIGETLSLSQAEKDSLIYSLNGSLPSGLIFTEQLTCYDLTNPLIPVAQATTDNCDQGVPNYQLVSPGTLWGQTSATEIFSPQEFTLTAANIHGFEATRTFRLSVLSPTAPKSLGEADYFQQQGQKLQLSVTNAAPFVGKTSVSTQDGKIANISNVDTDSNLIFVTVTDTNDAVRFKNGDGLDDSATFFAPVTQIDDDPTYLYDDTPIDDGANQPYLALELNPADIFQETDPLNPNIEEARSLEFSISPDISLLGVNFQARSGCYNDPGLSGNPDNYIEELDGGGEPDFTNCDDPLQTDYVEIRGGTLWGSFDPNSLPLEETEFIVTANSLNGTSLEIPFKLEVSPSLEPAEFSYSQDVLLKLQNQSPVRFREGDYISNNLGAQGIVKEVIQNADGLMLWVNVMKGPFEINEGVDNQLTYVQRRGLVTRSLGVNAKVTTSASVTTVDDVLIDNEFNDNIIQSTATNGRARLVYSNGNDLYIRVTEGSFETGNNIENEAGATLTSINNINAQNLTINLASALSPPPIVDSSLVYSDDSTGEGYIGVLNVRNIASAGTQLEVEVVKGNLGAGTTDRLYPRNPFDSSDTGVQISNITTNTTRYTALKDFPFTTAPTLENGSSVSSYTISPDLPEGISIDSSTGVISGTPIERSDFTEYTVTVSNDFNNPSYTPASYSFFLEVKDYFGIVNTTGNAASYILHKAGMGNGRTPCLVTRDQLESASTQERDIACFLDAGELDLYTQGIDLEIRAANDICRYVENAPFVFSRFTSGRTLSVSNDVRTGDYAAPECNDPSNVTVPGDSLSLFDSPQELCDFDYTGGGSASEQDYNCDEGEFLYTLRTYEVFDECAATGAEYSTETCGTCSGGTGTTRETCVADGGTWAPDAANPSCRESLETEEHACGGQASSCLAGAGTDILSKQELFDRLSLITNVQTEDKVSVEFTAPKDKNYLSNRYIANFINAPACMTGTKYQYNFQDLENLFRDRAIASINSPATDVVINSNTFNGRAFYTFNCLDSGQNIEARIRLVVRDWNRGFRASDDIDKISPDDDEISDLGRLMELTKINDPDINFMELTNRYVDFEPNDFNGGSCTAGGTLDTRFPDSSEVDLIDHPSTVITNGRCNRDCEL